MGTNTVRAMRPRANTARVRSGGRDGPAGRERPPGGVPEPARDPGRGGRGVAHRRAGRGARRRRRVGGRQVHGRQRGHRPAGAARRDDRRRGAPRGAPHRRPRRRREAPAPRQADRDDLPGPADQPEPVADRRAAARRDHRPASRNGRSGGAAPRRRAPAAGRHPGAGAAGEAVSAPVLRRDAPAGGDRARALRGAGRDHRGRADHRPRRLHPGADPRPHAGALQGEERRHDDHHPRHGGDRGHLRPGGGDVPGPAGGARRDREDPRRLGPRLHPEPHLRGAEAGREAGAVSARHLHRGRAGGAAAHRRRAPLAGAGAGLRGRGGGRGRGRGGGRNPARLPRRAPHAVHRPVFVPRAEPGLPGRGEGRLPGRPRGRDVRPGRGVGLGQVHGRAHDLRPAHPGRRGRPVSPART